MGSLRRIAPDGLAVLFATSGVLHVVRPTAFAALVPPALPGPAVIAVSGIAEVVCAIGLVRRARWAAPASAALLLAIFPGNVWFALAATGDATASTALVLAAWLRLPLQAPLVWAALQARHPRSTNASG